MAEMKFDQGTADEILGDSPEDGFELEDAGSGLEPTHDPETQAILDQYGNDPAELAKAVREAKQRMHTATTGMSQMERQVSKLTRSAEDLGLIMKIPGIREALDAYSGKTSPAYSQPVPQQQGGYGSGIQIPEDYDATNPYHQQWLAEQVANRVANQSVQSGLSNYDRNLAQKERARLLMEADRQFENGHKDLSQTEIQDIKDFAEREGIRSLEHAFYVMKRSDEIARAQTDGAKKTAARIQSNLDKPLALRAGAGGGRAGPKKSLEEIAELELRDWAKLDDDVRQKILRATPARFALEGG